LYQVLETLGWFFGKHVELALSFLHDLRQHLTLGVVMGMSVATRGVLRTVGCTRRWKLMELKLLLLLLSQQPILCHPDSADQISPLGMCYIM
jgi:hypothetical protein